MSAHAVAESLKQQIPVTMPGPREPPFSKASRLLKSRPDIDNTFEWHWLHFPPRRSE